MTSDDVLLFVYYFALFVISATLNIFACYIIVIKEKKKDFSRMFIFSISVSSFLQAGLEYIPQIALSFLKNFLTNTTVCRASGFMLTWFVINNILHMTVISLIRVIAIKFPIFYFNNLKCNWFRIGLLSICYAFGFIWTVFPLIGWSKYDLDFDEKRCSLDWKLTRSDSLSYIIALLIFCYFLPGAFIAFALQMGTRNIVNRKTMKLQRKQSQSGFHDNKFLKICMVSGLFFFVLWTPYAIFGTLALFKVKLPRVMVTIAARIGDLSTVSNFIVNCCINKSFKNHMIKTRIIQCFITSRPTRTKVDLIIELRNI